MVGLILVLGCGTGSPLVSAIPTGLTRRAWLTLEDSVAQLLASGSTLNPRHVCQQRSPAASLGLEHSKPWP